MSIEFEERKFKLWHYNVSHGELLFRSHKNEKNDKNIDIMFFDVKYLEVPGSLPNLKIEEVKEEEIIYVSEKLTKNVAKEDIYILKSNNIRYIVVASILKIVENDLDLFELPFI